jgi:hypothetical protein
MALKSPIAKILVRSLATTVVFVILYGIYLAIGRHPDIPMTLAATGAFYFAAALLMERFVFPRLGL